MGVGRLVSTRNGLVSGFLTIYQRVTIVVISPINPNGPKGPNVNPFDLTISQVRW
jgi:hypothetical protein